MKIKYNLYIFQESTTSQIICEKIIHLRNFDSCEISSSKSHSHTMLNFLQQRGQDIINDYLSNIIGVLLKVFNQNIFFPQHNNINMGFYLVSHNINANINMGFSSQCYPTTSTGFSTSFSPHNINQRLYIYIYKGFA